MNKKQAKLISELTGLANWSKKNMQTPLQRTRLTPMQWKTWQSILEDAKSIKYGDHSGFKDVDAEKGTFAGIFIEEYKIQ